MNSYCMSKQRSTQVIQIDKYRKKRTHLIPSIDHWDKPSPNGSVDWGSGIELVESEGITILTFPLIPYSRISKESAREEEEEEEVLAVLYKVLVY